MPSPKEVPPFAITLRASTDQVIVGSNQEARLVTQSYGTRRVRADKVSLHPIVRARRPNKHTAIIARDHVARGRGGSTDQIVGGISPKVGPHAMEVTVSDEAARVGADETTLNDVAGAIYEHDAGIESPINRQATYPAAASAIRNHQSVGVPHDRAADFDQDDRVVTHARRIGIGACARLCEALRSEERRV